MKSERTGKKKRDGEGREKKNENRKEGRGELK